MKVKRIICVLIAIFICMQIFAREAENFNIQKRLLTIYEAGAPQFLGDNIIFTFSSDERISFVGAAFDFDNYVKIHQFKKNPEGIFVLVIDIPETEVIKYRLIVDGLWMADPFNSIKIRESNSVEISVLNIDNYFLRGRNYPFTEQGFTNFRYRGEEGKSVYLAGNFNNWDPFMYNMAEKRPGEYFISLKLPAGNHLYYFIVNGQTMPDRGNPTRLWDKDSREISSLSVR